MDWKLKAFIQKAVSYLPHGSHINYMLQRNVTRSFPLPIDKFYEKFQRAYMHMHFYKKFTENHCDNPVFYEFGAGWEFAIPLSFYALGVRRQIVMDLMRYAKLLEIGVVRDLLRDNFHSLQLKYPEVTVIPPLPLITSFEDLVEQYGISYFAPADARETGFASESIDFCSNSVTLEHIPADDIFKILRETFRILKPGGCISCEIDLQDHYSYVDSRISSYNYLKFDQTVWSIINSALHYQNRLRYPEYKEIIERAGFSIVHEKLTGPTPHDLEILRAMRVDKKFSQFSLQELGVRGIEIVCRK